MSAKFPRGGGANPFSAIRLYSVSGQIVCVILTKPERCDYVVYVLMKEVRSYCVSLNGHIVFILMTKVPSYCLCINDNCW